MGGAALETAGAAALGGKVILDQVQNEKKNANLPPSSATGFTAPTQTGTGR